MRAVRKTAKIDIPKDPKNAYLLPRVSDMTFMTKRPMNDPNGKIDWMVTLAQLLPQ